jgi:hypothetical protein
MLGVPEGDKHGDRSVASLPDVIDKTNIVGQAAFRRLPVNQRKTGQNAGSVGRRDSEERAVRTEP